MPQFVRNPKTGEIGYWDGQQILPLKREDLNRPEIQDLIKNASGATIQFDPAQSGAAEDEAATKQALQQGGLVNPAQRAGALEAARSEMISASETPEAQTEQRKRAGQALSELPSNLGSILLHAAPAAVSGIGAGSVATNLVRNPGFWGRVLQRMITGGGSALGEYAAQEAGLNEPSGLGVAAAGIGGMLGGVAKKSPVKTTGPEASARRAAAAEPIAQREVAAREAGKAGFESAINSAAIDTDRMLQPIERVIMRETSRPKPINRPLTPEESTRAQILSTLEGEWATLGDHLEMFVRQRQGVPIPQGQTPTSSAAPRIQAPQRVQIPEVPASERVIPSGTPKQFSPSPTAPATTSPQTLAPGGVQIGFNRVPTMINAENLVDDIQRLGRVAELARSRGANDLYREIKSAVGEIREMVPDYDVAAAQYAKGKGYEEAKRIIRTGDAPANRIRNLLESSRRATTFTPKEEQAIIRAAEKSEGIGPLLSRMIRSPIGRQFLRAGITPDGKISNAMLHLGAQFMLTEGGRGTGMVRDLLSGGGE